MKLDELRHEIREMLCAHEAFRRLGFAADDIFIAVGIDPQYGPDPQVFVDLTVGVGFSLRVCPLWCDEPELRARWGEAVALWNDPSRLGVCQALWDASEMNTMFPQLANAIRKKGLALPAVDAILAEAARGLAQRSN